MCFDRHQVLLQRGFHTGSAIGSRSALTWPEIAEVKCHSLNILSKSWHLSRLLRNDLEPLKRYPAGQRWKQGSASLLSRGGQCAITLGSAL